MTSTPQDGFGLARTGRTLPIALLRAREAVMERFRPMLQANDVTEQQWRVLRVIHESEGLDASAVADRACILAPSLTRILKTLESREFLTAQRDPKDGRRMIVAITPEGRNFVEGAAEDSARIYKDIESAVGAAEVRELLDRLEQLLDRLQK